MKLDYTVNGEEIQIQIIKIVYYTLFIANITVLVCAMPIGSLINFQFTIYNLQTSLNGLIFN